MAPVPTDIVVVITGAGAGVGRATARQLAAPGTRIGLLGRGQDGLDAARKDVEALGADALTISVDVASADDVDAAAERVERELGPIDIWINNAMTSVFAPFSDVTAEEFRRVTEVTYLGCVNGTRAALRWMQPRDHGTIVQVGSALAYRGIPLQSAYCGSKHAIRGFTDALRTELLHDGSRIRVAAVHLPALNTPQFGWVLARMPRSPQPVPPIYQPEVAARAIARAAHHPRRERWVGAPTIATILAQRVAPGLLDRYLANTGYDSQQTDEPLARDRPTNLWVPVPGDHRAHGRFDRRAHRQTVTEWVHELGRRGRVALPGLAAAVLTAGVVLRRWRH